MLLRMKVYEETLNFLWLINCLNGVLRHLRYYRRPITVTALLVHVWPCYSKQMLLFDSKKIINLVHYIDLTRAITKRDHTPQQLLVTKQIVTGMQNKQQKRA